MQAPRDKLVCILNCCRYVNNLLNNAAREGETRGQCTRSCLDVLDIHVTSHPLSFEDAQALAWTACEHDSAWGCKSCAQGTQLALTGVLMDYLEALQHTLRQHGL